MAKVAFSALIEEIVGKLAGSVFQDSYGGYQIRTRVSPRNPRSPFQQARRGEFAFITRTWRQLPPGDRATWSNAAPYPAAAFTMFTEKNVNLSLIDLPQISAYAPITPFTGIQFQFIQASQNILIVQAAGAETNVPADKQLLLFFTPVKFVTRIFTNPSEFSPVVALPAGTPINVPIDVSTEYLARFGQMPATGAIEMHTALISELNGDREDEPPVRTDLQAISINEIIDSDSTVLIDSDGTIITYP